MEAALAIQPEAGDLWRYRAALLARAGRIDEAFENVQQALSLAPLDAERLLILADGYARAGLTQSAVDVYQQLATTQALPYEWWPAIFAGLAGAKRWQLALDVCRRATQVRPDDDAAYYAAAQALIRLGRPAEMVIGVLHKAVGLSPTDARYRILLATQLLRAGKQELAYACLAELPPESFAELTCACCAWKLLRLCVSYGDAQRSALFGAQLAHLAVAARQAGAGAEDGQ